MNIHEAVLQPNSQSLHSFYCNRQAAAAGRRRQAKVGNFHAPQVPEQLNSTHGRSFAKIIL